MDKKDLAEKMTNDIDEMEKMLMIIYNMQNHKLKKIQQKLI